MAFSNTKVEKGYMGNGWAYEKGTWNGAGVTTGTITADTTAGTPIIHKILLHAFGSDGDTAVSPAQDVAPNKIKITFTGSDTGDYFIAGSSS